MKDQYVMDDIKKSINIYNIFIDSNIFVQNNKNIINNKQLEFSFNIVHVNKNDNKDNSPTTSSNINNVLSFQK